MGLGNGFKDKCDKCGKRKMVFPSAKGEKLCDSCLTEKYEIPTKRINRLNNDQYPHLVNDIEK